MTATTQTMEREIRNKTMTADKADRDEWRDIWERPDAVVYDNGIDSAYRIGIGNDEAIWIDCRHGCVESVGIGLYDIIEHLRDYDTGDLDLAEYLAEGGLDGLSVLIEAGDDYAGACRIWRSHNYYVGTLGAPTDGYERDDDGEIMEFASRIAAQKYVDEYYNEDSAYDGIKQCNVMGHGQAGSDDLTIVESAR